jgi:L-seryl-tRNA(Ser) seleniumtransferase
VLKVHASNYRMIGFTEAAGIAEVASLGPPVMVDAGSGLLDETHPGCPRARLGCTTSRGIRQTLDDGAALVTFSGRQVAGRPTGRSDLGRRTSSPPARRHPARACACAPTR